MSNINAESVKTKLQSLLTASNAKTGKSDANLTDAVKTLLEGYGQGGGGGGGGGECSGNHIIEVDELPAVGEDGAYYGVTRITDIVMTMYGMAISLSEEGIPINAIVATSKTITTIEPVEGMVCYLTDTQEVLTYLDGEWGTDTAELGTFLGAIANKNEADASKDGFYVVIGTALYKYTNGQFKMLYEKGGLNYESNGDGTCQVDSVQANHDMNFIIPKTSPNGETVTGIDLSAFNSETFNTLTIPNTITLISRDSFTAALCNKIILEDGITEISREAFGYANCLEYTLPNTLTNIGAYAFTENDHLFSITIPASVTNIGDRAFSYCYNLKSIKFSGTVEQWNAITLGNNWYTQTQVTKVTCSDGEVTL